jgi:hypothetical protein
LRVLRIQENPTVLGPRLVPETLDPGTAFGTEPGGAVRFIAGGLRILRLANGGILTSAERFPGMPDAPSKSERLVRARALSIPSRLGGGSLFVVERTLLRSDTWLSTARPVYTSPSDIADVWLGMDRVYVRAKNGSHVAVDPRNGPLVDLGPWPRAPSVTSYQALDGWRAVVIADLRGAMASFDAGATWRPLDLPVDAQRVGAARLDPVSGEAVEVPVGAPVSGDFLFVQGSGAPAGVTPGGHENVRPCFALAADEPATEPVPCPSRDSAVEAAPTSGELAATKVFGQSSLLAAIEDGWPLGDGTVLVARDGALGRLRLSDGAWIGLRLDAFPPRPSRCHPLPMNTDVGFPTLGFACVEPRGKTSFYLAAEDLADPTGVRLVRQRAFDDARAVLSFGNGAIAVRGACEAGSSPAGPRYCVLSCGPDGAPHWAEIRAPAEAPDDRLLVSREGHAIFLSPPHGKLEDAHLTQVGSQKPVGLTFPEMAPEVRRAVESGVWLDGFEERAGGVFGGWVEASGTMLGVEVGEDGHVRVGAFVRDAGSPIASGRYGLGWSAARRAYQTTDGGMSWTSFGVPEPLAVPRERACGPIGCTAAGWIRVGWGTGELPAPELPAPVLPVYRTRPRDLDFECEPDRRVTRQEDLPAATPRPESGFYGLPPPAMRVEDQVVRADASSSLERGARLGVLARMFAWGPRTDDWTHMGRWAVQWSWPYGGSGDTHRTSAALAPFATLDAARRAILGNGPVNLSWSAAVGDEPTASLLMGKRFGVTPEITAMVALEADKNPTEIRRADGEPFADVDFAIHSGGHWYLVTREAKDEPRAAVVYRVDGSEAHEFARVPRAPFEGRAAPAPRLAHRTDGRAIGVVVDGQDGLRWVLPLDVETGGRGEPEPLGSADLADRSQLLPCTDEETGWVLDTTWNGATWSAKAHIDVGAGRTSFHLGYLFVRARLSAQRGCLEQLAGTYESDAEGDVSVARGRSGSAASGANRTSPGAEAHPGASLPVSVLQGHARYPLRCRAR